ncbi:SgcJ/EcaC family oxidoreductase [Desulfonatronovibrio hydrogenovorans]|uniref:SgcJ/EcaC family oxidoreductase n=1 Tax=Desulfonatronovibrio hydrogenovorans TaxID=53245 RepID=UPI00048E189C|nr:SgcJ/EcaC family oxidoreductase [Desulfonatronovibrio hydrogenovorans]
MEEKTKVSDRLKEWCQALKSADPENILACYDVHASLLPTLSSRIRRTRPELREYFEFLVQLEPGCTVQDEHVRIYGDIAINSGSYTFHVSKGGDRAAVPARFTFVYRNTGDNWLIVEHHSSLFPDD